MYLETPTCPTWKPTWRWQAITPMSRVGTQTQRCRGLVVSRSLTSRTRIYPWSLVAWTRHIRPSVWRWRELTHLSRLAIAKADVVARSRSWTFQIQRHLPSSIALGCQALLEIWRWLESMSTSL